MIQKILVPVDFSESSLNALETAIDIAARNKATIQILHVSDAIIHADNTGNPNALENEKQIFDAMAGSILQKHGVSSEILFMEGFVGPTIVKTAFLNKPDLIVMGAHGASGFRELFIGSNTYYVVKFSACPVLIIPEGDKWLGFQRMLYPARTTYGALQRYEFVRNLVKGESSSLEFLGLSVNRDTEEENAMRSMADKLKVRKSEQKIQFAVTFSNEKNVAKEVLDYADRTNADLIVISPALDVVNKQFFVGPFSQRIINHAKVPVLHIHK
jgi:Universal stress protein UspA and related nucleotide-binding proteins